MKNRFGIAATLALAGLAIGCGGVSEQQRLWLANGGQAYERQQYAQAAAELTRFINAVPNQPETARALYVRGQALARSGQRLQGRSDLTRCAETASDPDLRWRACAALGTIDYEDGQWGSAARWYARALEAAPKAPPADLMLWRVGVCGERMGRWTESWSWFQRIVQEYPGSRSVEAARRRIQIRPDHFAVQCGVFSSAENAKRHVSDLKRQGLAAYVQSESRSGGSVQVVLVGRWSSYDEAVRELARVKGYVPDAVLWP